MSKPETSPNPKNENVTISYSVGEHPDIKDRIMFTIDGTGLSLSNPDHKHFMEVLIKVTASQMYAKANGVQPENVEY